MFIPLDIHTHHLPAQPGTAIVCTSPADFNPLPGHWYAVGIHPWHAAESADTLSPDLARHPQVLAIGETGLDKLSPVPLERQAEVFRRQALLADAVGKPLIIHAVKATDELLRLKREWQPRVPWIVHGFRGKGPLAEVYLRHGFVLSFGQHYHPDALLAAGPARLLIETDESPCPVDTLYARAATLTGLTPAQLTASVQASVQRLFLPHIPTAPTAPAHSPAGH